MRGWDRTNSQLISVEKMQVYYYLLHVKISMRSSEFSVSDVGLQLVISLHRQGHTSRCCLIACDWVGDTASAKPPSKVVLKVSLFHEYYLSKMSTLSIGGEEFVSSFCYRFG